MTREIQLEGHVGKSEVRRSTASSGSQAVGSKAVIGLLVSARRPPAADGNHPTPFSFSASFILLVCFQIQSLKRIQNRAVAQLQHFIQSSPHHEHRQIYTSDRYIMHVISPLATLLYLWSVAYICDWTALGTSLHLPRTVLGQDLGTSTLGLSFLICIMGWA